MKTKLVTTCFFAGALLAPIGGYAADTYSKDSGAKKETVKEAVGDAVITTKIKAEYAKDKQVSAMKIHVDTDNKGVVTLTGNAKSQAEADKAAAIARDTKGVTSVTNSIQVGTAK